MNDRSYVKFISNTRIVKLLVGVCAMCKEHGVELTKHHVVEAPKDEKGNIRTLYLCQKCHDSHNLYINALISNKIPFDRTKEDPHSQQ